MPGPGEQVPTTGGDYGGDAARPSVGREAAARGLVPLDHGNVAHALVAGGEGDRPALTVMPPPSIVSSSTVRYPLLAGAGCRERPRR
jgi:hypothetical protein